MARARAAGLGGGAARLARLGVIGLALALVAGPAAAHAPVPSLASIPVDAAAGALAPDPAAPGLPLRVRVQAVDPAGLARVLGLPTGGPAGTLELQLQPGLLVDVGAPEDALAASFIVDHDDPSVIQLVRELQAERTPASGPPDGAAVVAFVARVVREAYDANTPLASEVARSLRGDCTEYALLTAALARRLGIPARMVQGAVMLHADGRWQAYGHAWVQTFEGGRWILRDSALAAWSGPLYHLPAVVMSDEGPGHLLGLAQGFGRMPSRIEVLGFSGVAIN